VTVCLCDCQCDYVMASVCPYVNVTVLMCDHVSTCPWVISTCIVCVFATHMSTGGHVRSKNFLRGRTLLFSSG
jgi:hypothetical protein